jgi:hypothetical protein
MIYEKYNRFLPEMQEPGCRKIFCIKAQRKSAGYTVEDVQ